MQEIIGAGGVVQKVHAAAAMTDREIVCRPIAQVRLDRLSQDQSIIARFQDSLVTVGVSAPKRAEILKLLRVGRQVGQAAQRSAERERLRGFERNRKLGRENAVDHRQGGRKTPARRLFMHEQKRSRQSTTSRLQLGTTRNERLATHATHQQLLWN